MTDVYAKYTRLRFDRPHPKVLRITMDNGKMNTADNALHGELAEIWRDVDRDPSVNVAILTGAGKVFSAGGDFAHDPGEYRRFRRARAAMARSKGHRLQSDQLLQAGGQRDAWRGGGRRSGLRHAGGCFHRDPKIAALSTDTHASASPREITPAIIWPLLCGLAKAKYYLLLCEQVLGAEAERIGLISLAVE